MGSGCSSEMEVKEGNVGAASPVKNTSLAENMRQRKNLRQRHGNLLNVIDESVDVTKAFKELAIQSRQPGLFWQAWAEDKSDNPEGECATVVQQVAHFQDHCEKQAMFDLQRITSSNEYIRELRGLLRILRLHDTTVKSHHKAEKEATDKRRVADAIAAKHKKLDSSGEDMRAAVLEDDMAKKEAEAKEAEMSLAAALTALENSAATVKEQRRAVPLHCLTMHYEALIEYHSKSASLAAQELELLRVETGEANAAPATPVEKDATAATAASDPASSSSCESEGSEHLHPAIIAGGAAGGLLGEEDMASEPAAGTEVDEAGGRQAQAGTGSAISGTARQGSESPPVKSESNAHVNVDQAPQDSDQIMNDETRSSHASDEALSAEGDTALASSPRANAPLRTAPQSRRNNHSPQSSGRTNESSPAASDEASGARHSGVSSPSSDEGTAHTVSPGRSKDSDPRSRQPEPMTEPQAEPKSGRKADSESESEPTQEPARAVETSSASESETGRETPTTVAKPRADLGNTRPTKAHGGSDAPSGKLQQASDQSEGEEGEYANDKFEEEEAQTDTSTEYLDEPATGQHAVSSEDEF